MIELHYSSAFKISEIITKKYSTSFSLAIKLLNKKMQKAIYGIYGFVRIADEIVDTFHQADQRMLLDDFERSYELGLKQGISTNPVLQAFITTVREYNISQEHVKAFLKSMRADLDKTVYESYTETNEYIYGSAQVVGLMCLKVFVDGDEQMYKQLEKPAMALGAAFQKVNFLRDLKADYEELNRTYFPGFNLKTFDDALKNEMVEVIENDFKSAILGIRGLPGKSRIAVWLAFIYYKQLLRKLKNTPATKLISTRIRVPNTVKLALILKAYFGYKLRLI